MTQNTTPPKAAANSAPARFKKGTWYSIEIPSIPEQILDVEEAIIEALCQTTFVDRDSFATRLALDEALANAIKHGNQEDRGKKVFIRFCLDDSSITITVRDQGEGFDACAVPDPTESDRLEIPSGRGLLLMRMYMDSVAFNDKGNEVTMVKRRHHQACGGAPGGDLA